MENRQPRNLLSLLGWRPGKLARNSGALLGWMLLRAGSQAAVVLLLARTLGASDYGKFVAIIAIASFVLPFVGLGLSGMVLRNGAKDPPHLPFYLQRAAKYWLLSLLPGTGLACLVAVLLLPAGLPMAATFAVISAELAATSLTELAARYRQAEHRINSFGAINAALPLARLAALLFLFVAIGTHHTEQVLWTYAAGSWVMTVFLWLSIQSDRFDLEGTEPMSANSGMPFSLANFAMRLQAEFNKPLLAHLGFDLAGAYNVAQRANDLASMPLLALQEAMWPRLYAHHQPIRELGRAGFWLLLLSIACCSCIWLGAPLLPRIFGSDFSNTASTVRGLALLPLLQSIRSLLNFHAIHHGRMRSIGLAYAIGAGTSVLSVTILVPYGGITGAVISAYMAELAMTSTLLATWIKSANRCP